MNKFKHPVISDLAHCLGIQTWRTRRGNGQAVVLHIWPHHFLCSSLPDKLNRQMRTERLCHRSHFPPLAVIGASTVPFPQDKLPEEISIPWGHCFSSPIIVKERIQVTFFRISSLLPRQLQRPMGDGMGELPGQR